MQRLVCLMFGLLLSVVSGEAVAQTRVALVVGVSDYKVGGKLPQTLADAEKMRAALASAGFAVEKLAKPTLSKNELENALLAFGDKAARADVAVLYFAGHGMQHGDDNWLIPASANLKSEAAIRFEGVALQDVMELMKPARFRIIILDACRNNPFRVNWPPTMSGADGLGAVPKAAMPVGSLVAFSAAPGQKVPNDGVYADALARMIRDGQGLELDQLMRRVRAEVQRKNPAALPEYIPNYEGSFSFSGGYDPDAGVRTDLAARDAQIQELQRQLAELKANLATTPAGPARNAKVDLVATMVAALDANLREDYVEARLQWQSACDSGEAVACANLGVLYRNGRGVMQDYAQARSFYQKGCDGGSALGCTNLGVLYENGYGVTQDYVQARKLFEKGCDGGSGLGCANLGVLYGNGRGVMQDYAQARSFYQKGCDGGSAPGCANLGFLYVNGYGVTRDYVEARKLFEKGCDGGSGLGCANLGVMYEKGYDVSQDYVQARSLYQKGCDGGEAQGCSALGNYLYRGLGGPKDLAAGRALLQKGCQAGNAWGCDKLKTLEPPQ